MEDTVTPNPTPGDGGASTLDPLDRIEAMLRGAESGSEDGQSASPDPAHDVKPDGDGQQSAEPQLTTSDLAKFLGIDETAIDLDEDGSVKLKTKVDGVEGAAKLQDLLKSYQLQEHVDKKAREAAEQEKALKVKAQEAEQQFSQRLQYAENLTQIAANQLVQEYQSINWQQLEAENPGHAALMRQKFQERQAQLRGVYENIENEKAQARQKTDAEEQQSLQREAQRLPELIPEWKDNAVATKERAEIREWAIKSGFDPAEVDGIKKASVVAALRKAMQFDKLQSSKPAIENKVRLAPKLVKPGQAVQNTKETEQRNLKTAVRKTGGKFGTVEDYLVATGKV